MARRAEVTCSPVEISTSVSLSSGNLLIPAASFKSLSVSPDMAETTTTMLSPLSLYRMTLSATFLIRSILPTEVPPYLCTTSIFYLHHNHSFLFTGNRNPDLEGVSPLSETFRPLNSDNPSVQEHLYIQHV